MMTITNEVKGWSAQLQQLAEQADNEGLRLELLTDLKNCTSDTYSDSEVDLPEAIATDLDALSQQYSIHIPQLFLITFQILLHRYTGQDEFLLFSSLPIRLSEQSEAHEVHGFKQADFKNNPSLRDLVEKAQCAVTPLDISILELADSKTLWELSPISSLFNITFTYGGRLVHPLPATHLSMNVLKKEEHSKLSVRYQAAYFSEHTIQRLLQNYCLLLYAITTNPMGRVSDFSLLTEEEQSILLGKHRSNPIASQPVSIHECFEQQALKNPEAIALTFQGRDVTYFELNQRSNQLAVALRREGIRAGHSVGICLERSIGLITAILGILKAGAAFVPIDATYPKERKTYMLKEASIHLIVTEYKYLPQFEEQHLKLRCMEELEEDPPIDSIFVPSEPFDPTQVAYIMFTSGSTGAPKGVRISHSSVAHFAASKELYFLDSTDVLLQLATISFDASILEIFSCLLNGARLVIFPPVVPTIQAICNIIIQERVTFLFLTAGLFHQLTEEDIKSMPSLKHLMSGGDVISLSHVKKIMKALDGRLFTNAYGPTESTIISTCFHVRDAVQLGDKLPIGRPIDNTYVYVLDKYQGLTPFGGVGELYIGGVGTALGYLNEAMTQERFVTPPFLSQSGERLYRTGDMVRYLPDGNLEFLSRKDQQVKIRGFRIELSEIENTILKFPTVKETIVLAVSSKNSDKQLIAYIVRKRSTQAVGESEGDCVQGLNDFLKENLPAYMAPSLIIELESMPLTPNGKINRRSLPEPSQYYGGSEESEPKKPIEEIVLSVFGEVLGLSSLSTQDNFFELGGHSLMATQLLSRLYRIFKVDISYKQLFEAPTPASLAKILEEYRTVGKKTIPIQPILNLELMVPSFSQQRLWFLNQLWPEDRSYHIPLILKLYGKLNVSAMVVSLNEIVRRHDSLRTSFIEEKGELVQKVAAYFPFEVQYVNMCDQMNDSFIERIELWLEAEINRPFDLAKSPLFRFHLIKATDHEHILCLCFHHIIIDGWSLNVLAKELEHFYSTNSEQTAREALTELAVQYPDFAYWQRKWLEANSLEEELDYWKRKLCGPLPVPSLPYDFKRPAMPSFKGEIFQFTFPKDAYLGVSELSRKEGVTLYMTLLAVFKVLIHRITKQSDILIGTPVANRNQIELESMVGFFVNTLVLRSHLSEQLSFCEVLAQVRETALEAYMYQNVPFDRLVQELKINRDMSVAPIFQIMFQLVPSTTFSFPNLDVSVYRFHNKTAKFDLYLECEERSGELEARLEFSIDLFKRATIEKISQKFLVLTNEVLENPQLPIGLLNTGDINT